MGLSSWIRRILDPKPKINPEVMSDALAMDTINRVLPRFAPQGKEFVRLRREAVYMMSSIAFLCIVVHPRFDQHSGHAFFNRYLAHINAYGLEAGLWPSVSPGFLAMVFPARLEAYLEVLELSDPTDAAQVEGVIRRAALLAASTVGSEIELPAGVTDQLGSMGVEQWDSTIEVLDA